MAEKKEADNKNNNNSSSAPYELYLVCKSNISIIQGSNPLEPLNRNRDFFVGDIFQAKLSGEHDNKYIQLRAASKANKKQWIENEDDNDDKNIMNIFTPSIDDYFHLNIGQTATAKCKYLKEYLLKCVDEIYSLYLDKLSGLIITYLPFSYPVFTINGTLFRGRGHFTQFSVPYFHSKSHCKEYLRRIELLRNQQIEQLNNDNEEMADKLEYEYEKKLMLKYRERMRIELEDDEKEEIDEEEEELLDAEYLNKIVSVQKGSLPKWITSIYQSISTPNSYFYCIELYFIHNVNMVPFKKDEYLEQNKYAQFSININNEKDKGFWNKSPILKAMKTGSNLEDIMSVNEVGGSRWFDIEFDPNDVLNDDECKIYDDTVQIYRCKVGGKWQGDSKSRHYIDVKDENGDVFSNYLPMIVINMVL